MLKTDLSLLRSFVTVVEAGGFTSAEQRVHRTQSTISQQIKRLERQLGVDLLCRSRNGTTPTEAGERVLSYARRMLALEWELAQSFSAQLQLRTLRLGITDDFAQLYLSKLLDLARRTLPQVVLRVTCDLSAHLRKGLARGDCDLAIYKRTRAEGAGVRILKEPIEWVAARRYMIDRRSPLPLLLFPRGCVYRQHALARLDVAGQAWSPVFESPSTVSVQAAVQAGLGIALLTASSIPSGCRAISGGLPKLGQAELVYEFGAQPMDEARELLGKLMSLIER